MMELPQTLYTFGNVKLDISNVRLTVAGELRPLEPKSFRLVQFLVENRHRVVPKDEILTVVWQGIAVTDNALTRAIAQIRKALEDDPKQPRYIETVPTVGYRFVAEVESAATPEPVRLPPAEPIIPAPKPDRSHRLRVRAVTAGVVIAVGALAGVFLMARQGHEMTDPEFFTTYPGTEVGPSFSPDGNQVAFTWNGANEKNWDIYVKQIGSETPLRLTTSEYPDSAPKWSPDGRTIAFLRDVPGSKAALMLIPPLGGPERKLAEFVVHGRGWRLDWSPDGKWLATGGDFEDKGSDRIYLVSVESGDFRPLTTPPEGMHDSDPALSPDGTALAFVRWSEMSSTDLYVLKLGKDLSPRGDPKKLPAGSLFAGRPAWSVAGREIIFVANISWEVYRISATGGSPPRKIPTLGSGVTSVGLTRDGRRLAYSVTTRNSNIWRLDLTHENAKPERFIASTRRQVFPSYSPDGRRIALSSNRSGISQIWVCDADGSNAFPVTSLRQATTGTPHWSPDGRAIIFDSNVTGSSQVYTVPSDGGKVRQVTHTDKSNYGGSWSRDGAWIYFTSGPGIDAQIWKMPSKGGEPVQVTHNGGSVAQESADGKTLYYTKPIIAMGPASLWKMPAGGGPEVKLVDTIYRFNYALTREGVYFTYKGGVHFLDFATGERRSIIDTPSPDGGLAISPDGQSLLFSKIDAQGSDLMLVEKFR
jgi:Tol biopolymer transport system component/DNA-binding winged helix-turn-helix (wHTH) protein